MARDRSKIRGRRDDWISTRDLGPQPLSLCMRFMSTGVPRVPTVPRGVASVRDAGAYDSDTARHHSDTATVNRLGTAGTVGTRPPAERHLCSVRAASATESSPGRERSRAIRLLPKRTSDSLKTRVGEFRIGTNCPSTTPSRSHLFNVFGCMPTSSQKRRRVIAAENSRWTAADPLRDPCSCLRFASFEGGLGMVDSQL